jgi:hypothetical protein
MDEGLFVKHLRSLKVRTDNKKEIISLIKEYSGIDIEDEEIISKREKMFPARKLGKKVLACTIENTRESFQERICSRVLKAYIGRRNFYLTSWSGCCRRNRRSCPSWGSVPSFAGGA